MKKILPVLSACFLLLSFSETLVAQNTGLVNTSNSPFAKLADPGMQDVTWTKGFWADRFAVCRDSMVPNIWKVYTDAKLSHAYKNFEIAARLDTGSHKGPSFHDGDFYKVLEAVASMYASTKDKKLDAMMDSAISTIAKVQRKDGYIYTKAAIEEIKTGNKKQFEDRLSFEAYNLGHLMTAGCIHYRATGKTNLLDIAKKATDYLYDFYKTASPALARNAICPSHYMGVVEMYRTTKDPRYLELAKHLIDIKGKIEDGTDDNQDRVPFREQTKAMGHAVRANYLYAGVADLYSETGDTSLLGRLNVMWDDVVNHKMYITGGCGSLYDGVSPDGTVYKPDLVQKIHQAYGRDYQLPNFTAHNETCANIGNVLWNYRMLEVTGEARYADVMELALYNSVLSGISLNGKKFLYTNPLAYSDDLPFTQRWSKDRIPYISSSNCCPPNVVRTIAEVNNYAYSIAKEGLYVNLYGGNNLATKLRDGGEIKISQETNYPWDGNILLTLKQAPATSFSIFMRIPSWSKSARISINGKPENMPLTPGTYVTLNRKWKAGDKVELILPMDAMLIEANPLVEETRNQVTVKRGPIVYCMESTDLPGGKNLFSLAIPARSKFTTRFLNINNNNILTLESKAALVSETNWKNQLYKEVSTEDHELVPVRFVPYFAWGNRGHAEMEVWVPYTR